MAGALQPRPFGVWPFNDCPSADPPARRATWGEEKTGDDGRRPTSRSWRRRGRGASRCDSRSEAEGTPKGLARPRSDSAPKGAAENGFEDEQPELTSELPDEDVRRG